MKKTFKNLRRLQVQEMIDKLSILSHNPIPKEGWIKTIREALEISSTIFAKMLGTSRANVNYLEKQEKMGSITLNTLERAAHALNCKLVYYLIPNKPLDQLIEDQAKKIAQQRINEINHSMKLEKQGLTGKQLKQQEDNLVHELLQKNLKKLRNKTER